MRPTSEYHEQFQSPGLASWGSVAKHLPAYAQIAFKNILFATDFSSTAELALPYAVEIARRSGATIHAVHVVQPDIDSLHPPSEWPKIAQAEKEFREEKKRQLEGELQGLQHEILMPEGDVWQNMVSIVEGRSIDLLILGTHGRTGMRKVVLGSVAENIFRQAACPVLTVGPAVSSKARRARAGELHRLLYATDFSPESLEAARYAIYFAKEYEAELILLHSTQNAEPDQVDSAYDTLRDVVPVAADLAFKPRCIVECGAAEDAILRLAAWHNTDMIVLGVRSGQGHLTATAHFSQSIASKVVTEATCPVLTVRG
jgi:nucleotide-binding universal stress UspA family protein